MADQATENTKTTNEGAASASAQSTYESNQTVGARSSSIDTSTVDYLVDPNTVRTPEEGDFYLGAVDTVYLKKIDELAKKKLAGEGNDKDAAFYAESPPIKDMGHEDGVYYLKAKVSISDDDIDQGFCDGRTVNVNINDVSGEDKALEELKKQLAGTMKNYNSFGKAAADSTYFSLRLVGLGCPATPKWAFEYDFKNSALNTQDKRISDIEKDTRYLFVNGVHDSNETLTFVKLAGKWREATFYDRGTESSSFRWLMDAGDDANEKARQAAKNLQTLLNNNSNEIYFLMGEENIKQDSSMSAASMGVSANDETTMALLGHSVESAPGGCAFKTGYCRTHQEAFRRFSGTAYVKQDGKFLNLAKLALTDKTNEELYPDENYDGKHVDLFNPKGYDKEKKAYADAFFEILSALDDRRKIQKEIFNTEFEELSKWTVTIGDVTFFVPPTNITEVSTVQNETQPMIRAKGSATKGGHRVTRKLQLEVFFNEACGINGFEKEAELPNGTNIKYSMNGLRQLIAQFKFTPFLPIENDYINTTLGIDAILFDNIEISNVPNYPKLYKAIITLSEFDYAAYIPELYQMADEAGMGNRNVFSIGINWAVMRYYYQRCIRKGDLVAQSGYKFNSDSYNKLLVGNRTTLIPMAFESNEIKFYIANKDYLDQMLAARMELLSGKAKPTIDFSKEELDAMKKLGMVSKQVKKAIGREDFQEYLKNAQTGSDGVFGLTYNDTLSLGRLINKETGEYPTMTPGAVVHSGISSRGKDAHSSDEWFNKCIGVMRDAINYTNDYYDQKGEGGIVDTDNSHLVYFTETDDKGDLIYKMGMNVAIGSDYLSQDENFQDLKQDASNYISVDKDQFFKDYKLVIPLKAVFKKEKDGSYVSEKGFELDKDSPDMRFLEFCENAEKEFKENEEVKKRRSMVNLNQLDSLVYDEYKVGTTYVQNFNVALRNHVSQVHINNISGTSAQYLGGEDTEFEFVIKTTSREAAQKLCVLPKLAAQYARDYHMLLPYYPLRVNSEITGFLGVNEVVISSARIDTGNEETGIYTVQLSLRSVDRTLRDRESMERTEIDNAGYNRGQQRVQTKIRTFFQIQDLLNSAELYPDLELPTIKEMGKVGYDFIRYKFQDGRKYVDPDFYFIYPQVIFSQVLRELALNGMKSGMGNLVLTDKSGASVSITPAEKKGYQVTSKNDQAKDQEEKVKESEKAVETQNKKQLKENLRKQNLNVTSGPMEQWAICDDITPMFLESKYRKECEAFEAYCETNGLDPDEEAKKAVDAEENKESADAQKTSSGQATTASGQGQEANNESKQQTANKAADAKKTSGQANGAGADNAQQSNQGNASQADNAETAQQDTINYEEGEWVTNKLSDAREASSLIKQYLETKPVFVEATPVSGTKAIQKDIEDGSAYGVTREDPQSVGSMVGQKIIVNNEEKTQETTSSSESSILSAIHSGVKSFLANDEIKEILSKINIQSTDQKFIDTTMDIIYAAACSATGEKEYAGKKAQTSWRPDPTFKAVIVRRESQDLDNHDRAKTTKEGVENGVRFGCFAISMYTKEKLIGMLHEEIDSKEGDGVNNQLYLLDPYYRSDPNKIAEYKQNCINNPEYCTVAFMRIMLFWMSYLIDQKVFPTITNDVLRGAVTNEMNIQTKEAQKGVADMSESTIALTKNISFFNKRTYAIDTGKIFTATIYAMNDGGGPLTPYITKSNYKALNSYIQSCSNPKTHVYPNENYVLSTRKMVLALVGVNRITDMNAIGSAPATPASQYYQKALERKYQMAAENPEQFIPDSFHDMIIHDARGRMLRAFPTFYMVFIDEGREIGQWRLHDNFYTTSALLSMQIVKSRKIAADTAIITMSNFYQSYTTEYDGAARTKAESWGDAFDSIFSPNEYAKKQEAKRKQMPKEVRIRIREGARMHIRMGYGSSANMLPVVFNGSIAEVSAEDTVEIVAQGDGIELMNVITDVEEGHELNNESGPTNWDIFNNSATPKEIMTWLLTRSGGWMAELAKDTKLEGIINCNPYGLYHFGSPDLKSIHKAGETAQNIFEAVPTAVWGDSNDDDAPQINIKMFQKTVWDVAHICKSVTPDFICSVVPFGFRSTLFIGAPRYYYAYDYLSNSGGGLIEKRKPFQQYHIYTAYSDIIADGIRASSQKMKTCAIGMYEVDFGSGSMQKKTEPVMADIDIYPEYQKTMIVDTRLFGKSVPMVSGVVSPITNGTVLDNIWDDKGHFVSNKKLATRMAISALIDSMRDMYCGDMIVLGDPTVKPHDRIYINDVYEGFSGQATVKEVVHNFNVNDGFTTTISPDCIIKYDAKFETVVNPLVNMVGGAGTTILGVGVGNALAYIYGKVPGISDAYKALKSSTLGEKATKKASDLVKNAGEYAEKIKGKSEAAKKAAETAGKAAEGAKKGVKYAKTAAKGVKQAINGIKAAVAGTGVGIPIVVAETVTSYVITECITSYIAEKLRNLNAVKVYPLERFCIPYTAGLEGSKGLVMSEHADKSGSIIKEALGDLFASDNPFIRFAQELFLGDEVVAAGEKLKRDNGFIDSSGDPTTTNDVYAQKFLSSASQDMGTDDYRSMMVSPRVDMKKAYEYSQAGDDSLSDTETEDRDKLASDISTSYQNYAMLDTQHWFADPKLKNNNVVSDDPKLKPYIDEQFLFILHEVPTLNNGRHVESQVITTSTGEEDFVKAIVESNNDEKVIDVAMLNQDAINILYEIVRRAKLRMPATKSSDQVESFDKTRGSYVILKSGLRIGDKTSYSSTGFSFIIQGTDQAYQPIIDACKELEDEIKKDAEQNSLVNEALFTYKYGAENGISNNEILVTVFMPLLDTTNIHEDTSGE